MSQRIGVGVIGAGIMGTGHAAAIADNPYATLVGVASLPLSAAHELADRYGADATDDYRTLLARDDIDLVTIATPDHLHRQICTDAAAAGKHFMVEKPLTTSLDEADELIEAVRTAGITAMTSFNHRWIPAYANAYDQIQQGRLGRPVMAYARKNDRIYVPTQMLSWAANTTPAWFLSSHDIDLVSWFLGGHATEAVATGVKGVLSGRGIDTYDAVQAQVRYDGGRVATFESCWIYPDSYPTMTDSFIEVVGESGMVHLERKAENIELATDAAFEYPRMAIMPTIHGRQRGAMADSVHHIIDCVRTGETPLVTMDSSRHVTAVLDAIHRSLTSGSWEPLR